MVKNNAKKIAELLKVLANESRLKILCILLKSPESVTHISDKIGTISQSALSQHLSLMKAHGILDSQKSGQNVIYSISDNRVKEVIDVLQVYYCDENK